MGAYCPVPHITEDVLTRTNKDIAQPIAKAMKAEGYDYFGLLLYWCDFNVRRP